MIRSFYMLCVALFAACAVPVEPAEAGYWRDGAGGGVSAPVWVMLDVADSTGSSDPNLIGTGAVTMSGDFLQIPVGTNLATSLSAAYKIEWALPSGFPAADGTLLRVRVTFGAAPTTTNAVTVGFYEGVANVGATGGARLATGDGKIRPVAGRGSAMVDGVGVSATALEWVGVIQTAGPWDNVGEVATMASSLGVLGTVAEGVANTGSGAGAQPSDALIVVAITDGFGTGAETLSVKCEYQVIPGA